MAYEYETDVKEIDLAAILQDVRNILQLGRGLPETFQVDGRSLDTSDLAQDERQFQLQEAHLSEQNSDRLAVRLRDSEWPDAEEHFLAVVDLYGTNQDYDVEKAKITLRDSGFDIQPVGPEEAKDIFAERMAETIAMRAASPGGPTDIEYLPYGRGKDTISSRFKGDDIICSKGWFISTQVIIGQSECVLDVRPGRYSLGVIHGGRKSMSGLLWSLPVGRHIHLALP